MWLVNKERICRLVRVFNCVCKSFHKETQFCFGVRQGLPYFFLSGKNVFMQACMADDANPSEMSDADYPLPVLGLQRVLDVTFSDVFAVWPEDDFFCINPNPHALDVKNKKSIYRLYTHKRTDSLVQAPSVPISFEAEVSAGGLYSLLMRTLYAADRSSFNELLRSVCLDSAEDLISTVALSMHRIAFAKTQGNLGQFTILWPLESANAIVYFLMFVRDVACIRLCQLETGSTLIEADGIQLWLPTLNNNLPDYKSLLSFPVSKASVNKRAFHESLCRLMTIQPPRVKISICGNSLKMMAETTGFSGQESILCESTGDICFCINPRYLLEALNQIQDENFLLFFSQPDKPIHLVDTNHFSQHVIMPIVVKE